jgi:phage terminase small subunit
MPKDLPPAAIDEWKRLIKSLSARGTLTKTDASAMEIYVQVFARWKATCAENEKLGPMVDEVVLDKNGETHTRRVINPCFKLAAQMEHLLARYLAAFSATPITREKTKPAAPPAPPKNAIIPGSVADIERQMASAALENPEAEPEPTTTYEIPDIGRSDQEENL